MKAKTIFEFQRSNDPKKSLNLGIIAEINKRAELYKVPNWETDEYDFFKLFYVLCQFAYNENLKQYALYFLENETLFKKLDKTYLSNEIKLYICQDYWTNIANYMIEFNFGLSYLKWVLIKAKADNEDVLKGPFGKRDQLATFLLDEYLKE